MSRPPPIPLRPPPGQLAPGRPSDRALATLLVVGTVAVFWRVTTFGFVDYDDPVYVYQNPHVLSGLSIPSVMWAWTTSLNGMWHPVTWLSFLAEGTLFGARPSCYHLTNLLLHLGNVLLLYRLLRRLLPLRWQAFTVAALFAWHPLAVESVAWIAERKGLLGSSFYLLCLLSYVKYARNGDRRQFVSAHLFFALGLLSKPTMVAMPLLLCLLDWWPLERFRPRTPGTDWRAALRLAKPLLVEKVGFALLAIIPVLMCFETEHIAIEYPVAYRVAGLFFSLVAYVGKAVYPVHLAVLYPRPAEWSGPLVVCYFAGAFVVTLFAVTQARRRPWVLVCWLWYVLSLLPVTGIVPIGRHLLADRYAYLPLVGMYVLATCLAAEALSVVQSRYLRGLAGIVGAAVLGSLAYSASVAASCWASPGTLWAQAIGATRDNAVACLNLGAFYFQHGPRRRAVHLFQEAVRCDGTLTEGYLDLAATSAAAGSERRPRVYYEMAARSAPENPAVQDRFARAVLEGSRPDSRWLRRAAMRSARACQGNGASQPVFLRTLMRVLAAQGNVREAARLGARAAELSLASGNVALYEAITNDLSAAAAVQPR